MKIKKVLAIICRILFAIIILCAIYWFILRGVFAKKSLKDTFNAMTTGDYTHNFNYVNNNGVIQKYLETNELGYLSLTKSKFRIEKCDLHWNSSEATVIINVSYPNVFQLFNNLYAESNTVYTTEEINHVLIDALASESGIDYCEEYIEVTIVQYGTKWYLIENEDLMNVYSGGFYMEYKEALSEMFTK